MGSYVQQMNEEFRSLLFWRAVFAEFVGMALFLFMGVGSTSLFPPNLQGNDVRIALAFGIAIATFVHITAHISGGHLNPAVTLAFFSMHRITFLRTFMYILAQMVGAVVGTGLLRAATPSSVNAALGPTVVNVAISSGQGVLVEAVLTFQLVLTIFATVDSKRASPGGSGPLAIGLSVFLGHLAGINYTGASMNPARTFGSAVVGGEWADQWVYWIGPIGGGILAAVIYDWFLDPNANMGRVSKCVTCDYGDEDPNEEDPGVQLGSAQSGRYNTFEEGAAS